MVGEKSFRKIPTASSPLVKAATDSQHTAMEYRLEKNSPPAFSRKATPIWYQHFPFSRRLACKNGACLAGQGGCDHSATPDAALCPEQAELQQCFMGQISTLALLPVQIECFLGLPSPAPLSAHPPQEQKRAGSSPGKAAVLLRWKARGPGGALLLWISTDLQKMPQWPSLHLKRPSSSDESQAIFS